MRRGMKKRWEEPLRRLIRPKKIKAMGNQTGVHLYMLESYMRHVPLPPQRVLAHFRQGADEGAEDSDGDVGREAARAGVAVGTLAQPHGRAAPFWMEAPREQEQARLHSASTASSLCHTPTVLQGRSGPQRKRRKATKEVTKDSRAPETTLSLYLFISSPPRKIPSANTGNVRTPGPQRRGAGEEADEGVEAKDSGGESSR
ncbi:hypothetical protein CRUP_033003, partial [Coryphaenoides rupestris]